jgi:hypothetical protein
MTTTINGLPINQAVGTDGVKSNEIDFGSGSELKIGGVAATGVTAAGLRSTTPSSACVFFDDFLGDLLKDEIAVKAGSGTGNAVALTTGAGGLVLVTSASDDGAITANASAIELAGLDWMANKGGLFFETRVSLSDVSETYIFIGFTDTTQASTLEAPIFLNAANIDSDATDACGVVYDVDGTTKQWCHGGVKNGTDTTPAYSGAAPTEGTFHTVRVEVSAAGAVQGFIDGVPIGPPVADAVTATVALLPIVVVANRSANVCTASVDYFWVQQDR